MLQRKASMPPDPHPPPPPDIVQKKFIYMNKGLITEPLYYELTKRIYYSIPLLLRLNFNHIQPIFKLGIEYMEEILTNHSKQVN